MGFNWKKWGKRLYRGTATAVGAWFGGPAGAQAGYQAADFSIKGVEFMSEDKEKQTISVTNAIDRGIAYVDEQTGKLMIPKVPEAPPATPANSAAVTSTGVTDTGVSTPVSGVAVLGFVGLIIYLVRRYK